MVLLRYTDENGTEKAKLRLTLMDVNVYVSYHDVYDTSFSVRRALDFFGRLVI